MAGFALAFTGLTQLFNLLRVMEKVDFGEAWVGSAVVYGPFQEFGTRVLQERPHWRVAIPQIVAEAGGDVGLQQDIVDGLAAGGGDAPMKIALKIERRVKEIITSKGIIDTNNYRGSIATGKTENEVFGKSAAKSRPETVATGR